MTTYVVVCSLVAAVCLGGAVLAWQLRDDDRESARADDDYGSVGVPWWSGQEVHWAGHSQAEDDVASLTATEDAAVYLHERLGYDDGTVPQPYLGTLTALFSDGTTQELGTRVVGVPLADPTGHVVAWMAEAGEGVVMTAFDTAERIELGSQRVDLDDEESFGLTAVVGDTVYLTSGRAALAWHPRDGDAPPQVVQGTTDGSHVVIGRTDDALLVAGEGLEVSWLGHDGEPLGAAPADGDVPLGTLSPDGRFLDAGEEDAEYARHVVAVPSGEPVDLGLPPDLLAYETRWAADGTLVVAAVSRADLDDGWDDAHEVTNFACDVAAGDCRALDGGPSGIYDLPIYDDSFLGQFLAAYEGVLS